jgi:hypothetical protein
MGKIKNEKGNRYGRLTVLEEAGRAKGGAVLWRCKCDCGNLTITRGTSLRKGETKSCGCLQKEAEIESVESQKLSKGAAAFNTLLRVMKRSAKERGLEWALPDYKVKELITCPCFYCGASGKAHAYLEKAYNGDFPSNGLDRIDNSKGYTEENVVPCCKTCNHAKNNMSFSEFVCYIDRISKHLSKINLI